MERVESLEEFLANSQVVKDMVRNHIDKHYFIPIYGVTEKELMADALTGSGCEQPRGLFNRVVVE